MAEPIMHKLGLFGHPVKHSQSPQIHSEFAEQFGVDMSYELIDATVDKFATKFKAWIKTAHGCNITVPHKKSIIPLLDHFTERAHSAQAVNTVFWQDGELWGDNTDGDGLINDLKQKQVQLQDAQVLILGAGGAAQGIIPSLLRQGVMHIDIKNRDTEKARVLSEQFDDCRPINQQEYGLYDLIIHATSMGHQGLCPEIIPSWFGENTIAYDLSYGAAAKPFLAAALKCGASTTYDGLGMLYNQAALAFELWFSKKPSVILL